MKKNYEKPAIIHTEKIEAVRCRAASRMTPAQPRRPALQLVKQRIQHSHQALGAWWFFLRAADMTDPPPQ